MIIHKGLIELDYNPATDVLMTSLPHISDLTLPEVEECFNIIIENLRNYDVKKLLLDSSKALVEVENAAYHAAVLQFAKNLEKTRLQKLARVGTRDKFREEIAAQAATTARQQLNMSVAYANFNTVSDAINWLQQPVETN